jgi:hypothetical protein
MFGGMKKGLMVLLLTVCFQPWVAGQTTFMKIYPLNSITNLQKTNDGGYIFAGSKYSSSTKDDWAIAKVDSLGNLLWVKRWSTPGWDRATSVIQTPDNGYLIGGSVEYGAGGVDMGLIKADSLGNIDWAKTYGGINDDGDDNIGTAICINSNGGFTLAGKTNSFGAGNTDIYVIRINANGDTLWTRTYGDSLSQDARCIMPTTDGGILIGGSGSPRLLRIDSLGNIIWSKTDTTSFFLRAIQPTSDGNYIACGYYNGNVYVLKVDGNGSVIWSKSFGYPNFSNQGLDDGYDIKNTSDGNYIVCGNYNMQYSSSYAYSYGYLIKLDSNGNILWTNGYYEDSCQYCETISRCLIETSDGFLVGSYKALVKTDINGNLPCHFVNTLATVAYTVNLNQTDAVCITGYTNTIVGPLIMSVTTAGTGGTICSNAIGINEIRTSNQSIIIYPNPTTGTFTIECNGSTGTPTAELTITDMAGRIVHVHALRNQKTEIRNSFSPGVYFVMVKDGERVAVQKLVVQ